MTVHKCTDLIMDQNTCDLMCQCHDMKLLPIYCEDCECPVCTKCLTTSHLKHNICDASVYVEKQRNEIMTAMSGECSLLEEIRCCLIGKRKTLEERKTKLLDEIGSREEAIVAEVREVSKLYKGIVSNTVLEWEENIQESENTLENISNNPEFKTESEIDCIKLIQSYGELRRLQREIKTKDPLDFTFEALKSISRMHIEELFGNLNVQTDQSHASDEDRQIEKKSPFHGKNVEKILYCTRKRKDEENQTIFLQFKFAVDTMKDFRGIVFSGENIFLHLGDRLFVSTGATSVCEEHKDVSYFCGLSSGEGILAITDKWTTLRVFLKNGKCMKLYQTDHWTRILAVEENVRMGISMLLEYTYTVYENLGRRQLHTSEKRKLSIMQVDENGQTKLISEQKKGEYPEDVNFCSLTNRKSHIAIICKKSLHVYNQDLVTLFVYRQGSRNIPNVPFVALCACLDPEDNILVANKSDNAVYMLDIGGEFLRVILWPEESLSNIISLAVDEEKCLWMGISGKEKFGEILLFDYDYLKRTKRIQRACTEIEGKCEENEM